SATGFQVEVVRKWNPNFRIASEDPFHSCQPIKMTSTTTTNAITSVSHSNALSPKREGGAMRARVERSSNGICTALIVVILSEAKNLRSRSEERRVGKESKLRIGRVY